MAKKPQPLPTLPKVLRFVHGDELSMVLRSHLALEVLLNKAIDKHGRAGIGELERLPFLAKVDVCIALGALRPDTRPAWVVANSVRNMYAHDLGSSVTTERAREFASAFPPYLRESAPFRDLMSGIAEGSPKHQVAVCFFALVAVAVTAAGVRDEAMGGVGAAAEWEQLRQEIGAEVDDAGQWYIPARNREANTGP